MASTAYSTIAEWLEATGLLVSDLQSVPFEFLDSPFSREELEQFAQQPQGQDNNPGKPSKKPSKKSAIEQFLDGEDVDKLVDEIDKTTTTKGRQTAWTKWLDICKDQNWPDTDMWNAQRIKIAAAALKGGMKQGEGRAVVHVVVFPFALVRKTANRPRTPAGRFVFFPVSPLEKQGGNARKF